MLPTTPAYRSRHATPWLSIANDKGWPIALRLTWPVLTVLFASCHATVPPDPRSMDEATFQRELAARFEAGPPKPAPRQVDNPALGQVLDAEYFRRFLDYDKSYSSASRARAEQLLSKLSDEAAALTHEQFVLRVAEIAALADNGHTNVSEGTFKRNTPRLPLRTYGFADGLHVLWATPAEAGLLGARIDTIDGRSISTVRAAIRRYVGGTDLHRDAVLTPMLESPALLQAAGVAEERDALTLSGVLADGQAFTRRIVAEQRGRSAPVSSTQRTLFPAPGASGMTSVLRNEDALPVYLSDREHLFTTAGLPGSGLYIGLAFNRDADEGPIAPFLARALDRVRTDRPAYVVLDMRLNGGGDYTTTYAFARQLAASAAPARVYVLTSPWTFSAAITTVAALKEAGDGRVSIVGESVGDRLDFLLEGDSFQLPNAGISVHFSNGRHVYNGPCHDVTLCYWLNDRYPVTVRTLEPDLVAPLTFAAYREMRDPALEAVQAWEAESVH